MKKLTLLVLALLPLLAASCSKSATDATHAANKRQFDAWMQVHHGDLYDKGPAGLGYYFLYRNEGTGEAIGEANADEPVYLRVRFTATELDGTILSSSEASVARQLGNYKEGNYYGPATWYYPGTYAGLKDILSGLRTGGSFKAIIPGWLLTYNSHDTAEEYLAKETGSSAIWEVSVIEKISQDIHEWELDSLARYLTHRLPLFFGTDTEAARADSTAAHGMYVASFSGLPDETPALTDTTVYVEYTGRLLNGQVFDTNVRDSAVLYGIWQKDKEYKALPVTLGSHYSDVKLDGSATIKGFSLLMTQMLAGEKAAGIFYSPLGYDTSGSGDAIPIYSPLRFDVTLVPKPEEE